MDSIAREQVEQVLDDLKRAKLSELESALNVAAKDLAAGLEIQQARIINLLYLCLGTMASEAVLRVTPLSNAAGAFYKIEQSLSWFYFESRENTIAWCQKMGATDLESIRNIINDAKLPAATQTLLDEYRPNFVFETNTTIQAKSGVGRNRKFDWVAAQNVVRGKLYRAELTPEVDGQVGIERALLEHFSVLGDEPGESTIRPYARDIFNEVTRKA